MADVSATNVRIAAAIIRTMPIVARLVIGKRRYRKMHVGGPYVALQEMWAITPLAHNSIWAAARTVSARRRSLAALSGCGSRLDRLLDLSRSEEHTSELQ